VLKRLDNHEGDFTFELALEGREYNSLRQQCRDGAARAHSLATFGTVLDFNNGASAETHQFLWRLF